MAKITIELGPAPSIPVRCKRLDLGSPEEALHSCSESSAVEPSKGQIGNVGFIGRSTSSLCATLPSLACTEWLAILTRPPRRWEKGTMGRLRRPAGALDLAIFPLPVALLLAYGS